MKVNEPGPRQKLANQPRRVEVLTVTADAAYKAIYIPNNSSLKKKKPLTTIALGCNQTTVCFYTGLLGKHPYMFMNML